MGVNLLLFHPQLLKRTCQQCQTWLFDDQHRLVQRAGRPVRRPPGSPTPCWNCPKKSPAEARGFERDMGKISRTLELYCQVRATAGRCLSDREASDPLLARNLAIVDAIVRRGQRVELAQLLVRGGR